MATVVAGSSAGTLSWSAYNYLMAQAGAARGVIGRNHRQATRGDGVYAPGARRAGAMAAGRPVDLHLMIFGDSTAAGVGARSPTRFRACRSHAAWPRKPGNESD